MQDLLAIRVVEGTKISHDYDENKITTFSYRDLIDKNVPAIGLPCKPNGLLVVDVDVEGVSHKHDGREFWAKFSEEYGVPPTYTVRTPSGGYHYYFKIPESINRDTFSPPASLSLGVDIKWNGWVGAPPSIGYEIISGNISSIQYVPPGLMAYISNLTQGKPERTFEGGMPVVNICKPFTEQQITYLRRNIAWIQINASLSRSEWRDGLFALKAGLDDPELLEEFVDAWTHNKAYVPGDELQAREIVERAEKYGPIGPGSIINIIQNIRQREGAQIIESPFTQQEIFDRARIVPRVNENGTLRVEPSESNAAALLGAIYDEESLYHDIRTDLYIYKGVSRSDAELVNMFLPVIQSPTIGLGLEKFRKTTIAAGLEVLMASRQKDPHQEYLKNLTWDGTPRIEHFFPRYVGTENTEYTRLVSTNFWTSLAARGLNPGCKFDTMVVIESHEGIMKSTLVEAIAGEYTFTPDNKDALSSPDELRKMHQSVITELPELMGLINEPAEKVKAMLSKPFDHMRSLYSKQAKKRLRSFILVGTTNSSRYLTTAMGARRFWPIRIPPSVKSINIPAVRADRDQLFAEAIVKFKDSHPYWYMPFELLDPVISQKVIEEPLVSPIREITSRMEGNWGTADVYKQLEAQALIGRGLTPKTVARIESALHKLGYIEEVNSIKGKIWKSKFANMTLEDLI